MMIGTIYLVGASILWGVVHSILASHGFKSAIRKLVGSAVFFRIYRFAYNLFAVASFFPLLLMLVVFPDRTLYAIPEPWVYLTTIIQGLGAIIVIAGVMQTGPMEFIGLAQLSPYYGDMPAGKLVTDGLYAYIRHPLYTGGLVFIWFAADMTLNRLILWIIFTFYIVIGAYFEERKLLRDFGVAYADYQAQTPMLIPGLRFNSRKS